MRFSSRSVSLLLLRWRVSGLCLPKGLVMLSAMLFIRVSLLMSEVDRLLDPSRCRVLPKVVGRVLGPLILVSYGGSSRTRGN